MTILLDNAHDEAASFYADCARILGARAEYSRWPYGSPDRWNNRGPGNGRFPGFGIIRMFGSNYIQVSLRHPVKLHGTYGSREAALSALSSAVSSAKTGHAQIAGQAETIHGAGGSRSNAAVKVKRRMRTFP